MNIVITSRSRFAVHNQWTPAWILCLQYEINEHLHACKLPKAKTINTCMKSRLAGQSKWTPDGSGVSLSLQVGKGVRARLLACCKKNEGGKGFQACLLACWLGRGSPDDNFGLGFTDPRPEGPYRAFGLFPTFSWFSQHCQDVPIIFRIFQTLSGCSRHFQDFPNMFIIFQASSGFSKHFQDFH